MVKERGHEHKVRKIVGQRDGNDEGKVAHLKKQQILKLYKKNYINGNKGKFTFFLCFRRISIKKLKNEKLFVC